jgi:phosphatidylinositol alpha-1,6-mannosyltransferase
MVFAGIEAFGATGGVQAFNRRLVRALAEIVQSQPGAEASALMLRDRRDRAVGRVQVVAGRSSRIGFSLRLLARARRADILLVGHINLVPLAVLARLLHPRLKLGLCVHGIEVWDIPGQRRARRFEPFLLRRIGVIASVSAYTAATMARAFRLDRDRFALLPNAVDAADMSCPDGRDGPVLAVTRMAEHDRTKNLDALIRAFAALQDDFPEARLRIVGEGSLRPGLLRLVAELGQGHRIDLPGRLTDPDLGQAYAAASVFALPSDKEGFGIVYLEAWKAGLPVICGSGGAAPEVVEDGVSGLVADAADEAGLARAIGRLLADGGLRQRMARAGQARIRAEYSHEALVANLSALWQRLADA